MEFERPQVEHFATEAQAWTRVQSWMEECNHDRCHSSLRMRSPVQFELALQTDTQEQAA